MRLTDLRPSHAVVGYGSLGMNGELGYEQKRLSVQGQQRIHALSAHAPSELAFALEGRWNHFRCHVALNDDVAGWGPHTYADFIVKADDKVVAVAPHVCAGDAPRLLEADVRGAVTLTLLTQTRRFEGCHSVWLDPELETTFESSTTLLDPLARVEIMLPKTPPSGRRCVATLASAGYGRLLDDMLASLRRNGRCDDALVVVFLLDGDDDCRRAVERHGAIVVPCTMRARPSPMLKSALYAVARVIDAAQFICVDADALVVGPIDPLFDALDAHEHDSILVCPDAYLRQGSLMRELCGNYQGVVTDLAHLLGRVKNEGSYPLLVNDGVFAGSRRALLGLDALLRTMPNAVAWIDQKPQQGYRNQFVFNLALARMQCGVAMDAIFNVQMHQQDVVPGVSETGALAYYRGRPARILHFCGWGRPKHERWREVATTGRWAEPAQLTAQQPGLQVVRDHAPLVSCIMPTRDRPDFVRQAIRYFKRQDYPNRELIIVDDSEDDATSIVAQAENVRCIQLARDASIGAKRNRACELARGDIVMQWDDDDWYAPGRIRAQTESILSGKADITGLISDVFFDLANWRFWRASPALHKRMFVEDVHGGTLAFRRSVWQDLARYPDASLAEDAVFLRRAMQAGARLLRIPGADLFIYLRHGTNQWRFVCGEFLGVDGWIEAVEPLSLSSHDDREFYLSLVPEVVSHRHVVAPVEVEGPLVSCIMPTFNRRQFIAGAISDFLGQRYANKELIVVDDGDDAVQDMMPADEPRVRYVRLDRRHTIGAKRNLACDSALGTIIAHWDDDDWHAPYRLSYQAHHLLRSNAQLCGINQLLFLDLRSLQGWRYAYPAHHRFWLSGSTLLYARALWQRHPFDDVNVGEDARFVWSIEQGHVQALERFDFHVGLIHEHNTSPKHTSGAYWHSHPTQPILDLIGISRIRQMQPSTTGEHIPQTA